MTKEYLGRDLEAMHFAVRYHRWIFELARPHLGKRIAEVGAGSGSFSEILLEASPEAMTLIEPSGMFDKLVENPRLAPFNGQLQYLRSDFPTVANEVKRIFRPDTVVYINVLEHIEDDRLELQHVYDTLEPGGRVIVFVPALKFLYSQIDRDLGHFRRYSRTELISAIQSAGFEIVDLRWFDSFGVLPWFLKYKLFRSTKMEPAAVAAYDRIAVPFFRRIEQQVSVPFGKNLFAVGVRRF